MPCALMIQYLDGLPFIEVNPLFSSWFMHEIIINNNPLIALNFLLKYAWSFDGCCSQLCGHVFMLQLKLVYSFVYFTYKCHTQGVK